MPHTTWREVKARRPLSPEARRSYNESSLAIEVADQVRQLRTALGLSQEQLAERVGTTQPMIARLEGGGQPPSLRTLERLADALQANLSVRFVARAS
ncbi:MAG: helix-turn-helix domain-containing protein [Candidatus Dormibacteria bacterium]